MSFWRRLVISAVCVFLCLSAPVRVYGREAGERAQQEWVPELLERLDLESVDGFGKQELPERLTFSTLVGTIAGSGDGLELRVLLDYLLDLFFYEFRAAKPMFVEILCICLLFSLFGKLLVTRQRYVSELGFFAVYAGIVMLLLNSFLLVNQVVEAGIDKMLSFMTAFVPVYAAALLLSGNMTSAGVFYGIGFGLIYLLEITMKTVFIPAIHIFVLLVMMDNLFEETRLSRLADMIESGIQSALRLSLAAVAGLGVVQSLIAPAKDRLSANGVFKTLEAFPGVGNTIGAAGEILVGCGILIKNSVGVAALIVLFVLCAAPAVSVGCFHVMYRLVGALLQPFCDRRIGECVHGVGRGCGLYLKIVVDTMLLMFITVSMISASTSFIY